MKNKTKNSAQLSAKVTWNGPPVALLWDQSLVWGLICWETLRQLGIPFHLLSGGDLAQGVLKDYRVLLVPGGWASHKVRALGESGKSHIKQFIGGGGSYLGFCGGAGLALASSPALGLVPLERLPRSQRIPSASGEIWIEGISHHPAWQDLPANLPVSIWWPSQFAWQPMPGILALAAYANTGTDFWVADLPVSDLESQGMSWPKWEQAYGINLNPKQLMGQPAIIEARSGKGRLILSYPHLETPGDLWGNRLLVNLLTYLDRESSRHLSSAMHSPAPLSRFASSPGAHTVEHLTQLERTVNNLIQFGERHLLWKWHLPWLLRWQRGIRGLEYSSLAVAMHYLAQESRKTSNNCTANDPWLEATIELKEKVRTFCHLAKKLLLEEKLAAQSGHLSKLGTINANVDHLRDHLFGNKMNHGGLCRILFDQIDYFLLHLLRQQD